MTKNTAMREHQIALTGHRPHRLGGYDLTTPFYERLRNALDLIALRALLDAMRAGEPLRVHTGMALGADTVWAEQALALRRTYGQSAVQVIAHVPFPGQAGRWPGSAQRHYESLLAQMDEKIVYAEHYSGAAMAARNEGMLDTSRTVIAVYDGSPDGGTANAVRYAKRTGMRLLIIDPHTLR